MLEWIGYTIVASFWLVMLLAIRAIYRNIRTAQWGRAIGFTIVGVILVACGLFVGLTPGSAAFYRYLDTRTYFGRGFFLGSPILSYDSPRSFHGDGYSIEVFRIPDSLAQWASSPPPEFLKDYPCKPPVRSHWRSRPWSPTPVTVNDRKLLDFALTNMYGGDDVITAQKLLRRLAEEKGNYISAFYLMRGNSVGNVDLFLLSPSEHILIVVNFNT